MTWLKMPRLPAWMKPPPWDMFPSCDLKYVCCAAIASGTTIAVTAIVCGHLLAAIVAAAWIARH